MHRTSIHVHGLSHFNSSQMLVCYLSGFSIRFQKLSRAHGQVTYVLLTRSPLDLGKQAFLPLVRLACIRHAASVHPEPGSNSPFDLALRCLWHLSWRFRLYFYFLFSFQRSSAPQQCSSILPNTFRFVKCFFIFFHIFYCIRLQRWNRHFKSIYTMPTHWADLAQVA